MFTLYQMIFFTSHVKIPKIFGKNSFLKQQGNSLRVTNKFLSKIILHNYIYIGREDIGIGINSKSGFHVFQDETYTV